MSQVYSRYFNNSLIRLVRSLRDHGLVQTLNILVNLAFKLFIRALPVRYLNKIFSYRREVLGEELSKLLDGEVVSGPFKGLILGSSDWGARDRASMLLGCYEKEVAEKIVILADESKYFVDIGAADGYYALGVLSIRDFTHSICFESSEKSRKNIKDNARRNRLQDKVTIFGTAGIDFLQILSNLGEFEIRKSIFLIDIEGGEYSLLSKENLRKMEGAKIIAELHEEEVSPETVTEFITNASEFFEVEFLTTNSRNPSSFTQLDSWSDNDRWIVFSEGRNRLMRWAVLTPKGAQY